MAPFAARGRAAGAFLAACAYYGVLFEALAILTATVFVATWLKR